jgi:ABC-2 type transport system permease protein
MRRLYRPHRHQNINLFQHRESTRNVNALTDNAALFASNALYPISMKPPWLQFFSRINPLTYEVDALHASMAGR